MSGILFKSEGLYVGDPGDIWDSFIFVIALNSSRSFGDISLNPHIVCFALLRIAILVCYRNDRIRSLLLGIEEDSIMLLCLDRQCYLLS